MVFLCPRLITPDQAKRAVRAFEGKPDLQFSDCRLEELDEREIWDSNATYTPRVTSLLGMWTAIRVRSLEHSNTEQRARIWQASPSAQDQRKTARPLLRLLPAPSTLVLKMGFKM